ncbi:MAG TPA: hypothetical protein VMB81_26140 [Candidatus Sulfotelmatobacter sp.]|nr:hypothetical protein [Candidatus Sulfotelmatobacter sp.]
MRVATPIGLLLSVLSLLAVAGCGSDSAAKKAAAAPAAATMPAPALAGELSCLPWPDAARPPADAGLLRSPEQDVPGTASGFGGAPVQVTAGLACVTQPKDRPVAGLYCGAAEPGEAPRPCVVGQECTIGSIMVTEINQFHEADGVSTCAVFENWSKTHARTVSVWLKPR